MIIRLYHRQYGLHSFVKEIEVEGTFRRYGKRKKGDDYEINESRIIEALPKKFLPVKPGKVLLTVGDKNSSTGMRGLKIFLNWAKYFDSYCLELCRK